MNYQFFVLLLVFVIFVSGFYLVSENCFGPKSVESRETVKDSVKTVLSYVPHGSLIRTAQSWYDRGVTTYHKKDGEWIMISDIIYVYHYPIFGLGKFHVTEKNLIPKLNSFSNNKRGQDESN